MQVLSFFPKCRISLYSFWFCITMADYNQLPIDSKSWFHLDVFSWWLTKCITL